MKYEKIIKKFIENRSSNKAHVAVALVAGLAAGAVISMLFAPDSGAGTRSKIASGAKNLSCGFQDKYSLLRDKVFGTPPNDEFVENEIPHFKHKVAKKRKSDLKDIVEQAHKAPEDENKEQEDSE